jgi:hypothetical protein
MKEDGPPRLRRRPETPGVSKRAWEPAGPPSAEQRTGEGRRRPERPRLGSPGCGLLRTWQSQASPARSGAGVVPAPTGPAPQDSRRRAGTHLPSPPRRRRRRRLSAPPVSHDASFRCDAQGREGQLAAPRLLPLSCPIRRGSRQGEGVATRRCMPGAGPVGLGAGPGRRSDGITERRKRRRALRSGVAAGPRSRRYYAGHREDFPTASGRLGVGGR